VYQGNSVSRGETRFTTVVGCTPAHKAYNCVGLIGIDAFSPYQVWIGYKLSGMQVTPFVKTAIPKMAWSEILGEPGRSDDPASKRQAQAVPQYGGFGIRKGQVWHAEESGRQGHGDSANCHREIGAKLAQPACELAPALEQFDSHVPRFPLT
jgi:hypothetical protein